MDKPPEIFDRHLLRQRKTRAAAGMARAAFLLEHVAADFAERLALIKRRFALGLDLSAHGTLLSDRLLRTGKVDRMLRSALVPELCGPADGDAFVGDEETLAVAPGALDLVVSGLSLQLVNDVPGALRQIASVLKPDGLFLAAVLGPRSLEQLRAACASAEIALTGGLSPRVAPFADIRDLGALLQRAGFALPVTDTELLTVTYPSPVALMADLKAMGASNVLNERRKTWMRRDLMAAVRDAYARDFASPDGRVPASFEIVTLTGWAPHDGQQKPLRPGSARASLESAMTEIGGSAQGDLEGGGHRAKD